MEILLHHKEVAGLGRLPRGVVIECLNGRLWITRAGDNNDHILGAGNRYRVDDEGQVVIMAHAEARLRLSWPQEQVPDGALVPALT